MKSLSLVLLLALAGCSADAAEDVLKPTMGTCSAAFFKSDELRDTQAAMQLGLLGFAKFSAMPVADQKAYEASVQADRAKAMGADTSKVLIKCRAQLGDPVKLGG